MESFDNLINKFKKIIHSDTPNKILHSEWVIDLINYFYVYKNIPDNPAFYTTAPDEVITFDNCKELIDTIRIPNDFVLPEDIQAAIPTDLKYVGLNDVYYHRITGYLLIDYERIYDIIREPFVTFRIPAGTRIYNFDNAFLVKNVVIKADNYKMFDMKYFKGELLDGSKVY